MGKFTKFCEAKVPVFTLYQIAVICSGISTPLISGGHGPIASVVAQTYNGI